MDNNDKDKANSFITPAIIIGFFAGAAIGIYFGILFDKPRLGAGLGTCLGIAIGLGIDSLIEKIRGHKNNL